MRFRYHLGMVCAALALWPLATMAAEPIKIGFPIPLSGPTAVYGKPVLQGDRKSVV